MEELWEPLRFLSCPSSFSYYHSNYLHYFFWLSFLQIFFLIQSLSNVETQIVRRENRFWMGTYTALETERPIMRW